MKNAIVWKRKNMNKMKHTGERRTQTDILQANMHMTEYPNKCQQP